MTIQQLLEDLEDRAAHLARDIRNVIADVRSLEGPQPDKGATLAALRKAEAAAVAMCDALISACDEAEEL